jgi:NAD(P)-dependent dehydrogenase (short-subunit alcohol dehydrogenase family)
MSTSNGTGKAFSELADLSGRVAIVTGAGRPEGLGFAIASRLSEAGAALVLNDFDDESVKPAVELLRSRGRQATGVGGDITDQATADRAIATAVDSYGRVDILVNNAAIWPMRKFLDLDKETFVRAFEVNTAAPMIWTQAVIRQCLKQGTGGSIINICANAALSVIIEELLPYEASKAALLHTTHGIARAFAQQNIRVNNIIPGPMATSHSTSKGEAPMGRRGEPDELARVALFLASDLASYVTGADWRVDGGKFLGLPSEQAAEVRLEADKNRREVSAGRTRA